MVITHQPTEFDRELEDFNISDFIQNYRIQANGQVVAKRTGQKMKQYTTKNGYKRVTLSKGGYRKQFLVHRLVAWVYIDNDDEKPCVNHKDSDRENNNHTNLEWVTYQENTDHGVTSGNIKGAPLRTRCKNGHLLSETSVINSQGNLTCSECNRKRAREWKRKQRQSLWGKK